MDFFTSVALLNSNWSNRTSIPELTEGTHIWAIELRQSPEYQQLMFSWLSDREKTKSQRMLVSLKRDYQIQARAWLRWLVAKYTKSSPEKITYRYGSLGKPYLASENQNIFFNATDSGNTLLCGFSKHYELGIDVESAPRNVMHHRIADKKFTRVEQQALYALPEPDQNDAFLALWTRKEAFGKALGIGIRYPMKEFNLCDNFNSYKHQTRDNEGLQWNLFQFGHHNNIACLTTRQNHENITFYQLDIDLVDFQNE